jgi:hypothetical protein
MFHVPDVRRGSQLALTGVVWFHNIMVRATDVPAVTTINPHNTIFCPLNCTTLNKKKPIDNLAMAFPVMAKLLAT